MTHSKRETVEQANGLFHARLRGGNGEIQFATEEFPTKFNALRALDDIANSWQESMLYPVEFVDETKAEDVTP